MDKRRENVVEVVKLLDDFYNATPADAARYDYVEKFLDVLTEEISARQAESLLKVFCSSSQSEHLADSILEKVRRDILQATSQ